MLSNDAFKLLRWLEKNDKWMTKETIAKECKSFDDRAFKTITTDKLIETRLTVDEDSWAEYRISSLGKAYLEGIRDQRLPELREWINTLVAIGSFLSGVIFAEPVKYFLRWIFELLG